MLCNICRKYIREKQTTQILLGNIEILKHSLAEHQRCLEQKHAQFMQLKEHATERLNQYTQLKYYHYNHQRKNFFFQLENETFSDFQRQCSICFDGRQICNGKRGLKKRFE